MQRIFIGATLLLSIGACDTKHSSSTAKGEVTVNAPSQSQAKPSTDIDSLAEVVSLPHRPQSALWQKAVLGGAGLGPTDWSLTALLEYSEADAKALVSATKPVSTGAAKPANNDWLPEDARRALQDNAVAYEGSAFYRSPLLHGSVFHLHGSNRFILYLFTM